MIKGVGKSMRMKRVIDHAGVSVICALDHGMTSPQFLEPLADIVTRTKETVAGGANVIMMSKGMIRIAEPAFGPTTSLALLPRPRRIRRRVSLRSSRSPRSRRRPGWAPTRSFFSQRWAGRASRA